MLMAFCIVISTKQIAGDPIECDQTGVISRSLLNAFCYIHSTYSLKYAKGMKVGEEVIYPGIKNSFDQNMNPIPDDKSQQMYHYYYQWVWFILLFQAICFYFPRWLWKIWESDKMSSLVCDLGLFSETEVKTKKKELIVDYLMRTVGKNDWYAIKYLICEILALLNVFGQMGFIDGFLGGEFFSFGFDVIRYTYMDPEIRVDPMIQVLQLVLLLNCLSIAVNDVHI